MGGRGDGGRKRLRVRIADAVLREVTISRRYRHFHT
jgi:hypothetical protein